MTIRSEIVNGSVRALLLIVSAVTPIGCSREHPSESVEAVKQFGYGPRPDPHVRYQPDVVMIEGGANAVRGVSSDGLTWTIDSRARGAHDLKIGQIMFATSRAVGRVAAIQERERDLAVTLVPVSLTEVVRDAKIDIDMTLPPESFVSYESVPPQVVSEVSLPDAGGSHVAMQPAVWRQGTDRPWLRPAGFKSGGKVTVGDWEVEGYFKTSTRETWSDPDPAAPPKDPSSHVGNETEEETQYGLKAAYKAYKRLKCGLEFRLGGQRIRTRAHLEVSDGKVNEPVTFVIDGIDRLNIGLLGGTETGQPDDNVKNRIEVPFEQAYSIPPATTGGVPLAVHLKFKFIVETAMSGANSTMWAGGQYKLAGPLGFENGAVLKPQVTVEKPMIDNIHGILVGASGIVIAAEFRFLLGLGTEIAMAGPYGKVIVSVGTSRGSFLGFYLGGPLSNPLRPVIDCRGVTAKGDIGIGVGLLIDKDWASLLKKYKIKTELEFAEKTATFWGPASVTSPQSAICGGT